MANLWIRTQNKTELTKVDSLGYKEYRNTLGKHNFYIYCQNAYILGEYSTKERCIEIIDEIQDALCGNVWKYKGTGFVDKVTIEPISKNVVTVINKEIIELPHHDTFVYEMPEE